MTNERRSEERLPVNISVKWNSSATFREYRIEDISASGCFVNTLSRAALDEPVALEMKLPSGDSYQIRGKVTAYQCGIGFGLTFSFPSEEEKTLWRELIATDFTD